MRFFRERKELIEVAQRLAATRLSPGTSGNLSVRVEDGMLLTPTGMPYDRLTADDLVEVRQDGRVPPHQRNPSSEWRIHHDVYAARPNVNAVVHAHPMFSTTLSLLRRPIPAVHYMIAVTGSPVIRCAEYATFGTKELSDSALTALAASNTCLLANHGLVSLGETLERALKVAFEVELLAEQYWRALQVGEPHVLDDEEIRRVIEKFRTYGQQKPRRTFGS